MFSLIASNVLFGWLYRRLFDWGGWLAGGAGSLLTLFLQLPPDTQGVIIAILTGNWQAVTLAAVPGLIALIYSQVKSLKATKQSQIVSADGTKIELPPITKQQALDAAKAATGVDHVFVGKR